MWLDHLWREHCSLNSYPFINEGGPGYDKYTLPIDPANGKFQATTSHKDDGRGDRNRLTRYQKAMKDHLDFGHNQDPKKAIEATRAEFKSKMTKEEFELQKENWTRYQIAYNDTRPEFLYAMLKSSLDGDLYLTVKAELDELGGKMEQQDINRLLKRIETIAVQFVPNDEYLKAFENVKQDEGEKVDAYLGRLQTEARRVEIKKPGKCMGHPTCKLTDETGPCTRAKLWEGQ